MPHQRDAAQRLAGALPVFRGALLADQVGLGKSYVALAMATRYHTTAVAVPATLAHQWRGLLRRLDVRGTVVTHEGLSRGVSVPVADLVIVDEAHRFRNADTRRYDRLARGLGRAHTLLVTATPVVNRSADLINLLRLFLADHALAALGLPSLERAVLDPDTAALMHAIAPLVVGRSQDRARIAAHLPATRDLPPITTACLPPNALPHAVQALDALRFPSFGREASALLSQHIFHRLSSSVDASLETLGRHRRYVDRATDAARRGETLSRGAVRRLFGSDADEPQLSFDLSSGANGRLTGVDRLEVERVAIERAMQRLGGHADPKIGRLRDLLSARRERKTLVFTTARSTALAIANALEWRAVAVVASGRARFASGPVSVDDALNAFAPRARQCVDPPDRLRIDVLIATDFASEGLDLQDADAVVHYDLPWTPLRLEQRIGRIARLGSRYGEVEVWWFVPPHVIEERVGVVCRIGRKMRGQLRLAVTRSSRVGRAGVTGGVLDAREGAIAGPRGGVTGFAVTRGPRAGVAAIAWPVGDVGMVRELIGCDGTVGLRTAWEQFVAAESRGDAPPPQWSTVALRSTVRRRCRLVAGGPQHDAVLRLRRAILRRARRAGKLRETTVLDLLDRALERLHRGVPVGGERSLADILRRRRIARALEDWLADTGPPAPQWRHPRVEALLVSDPQPAGR